LLLLGEAGAADAKVKAVRDLAHLVEHGVDKRASEAAAFEVVEVGVFEVEGVVRVAGELGRADVRSHSRGAAHAAWCHVAVVSVTLVRAGRLEGFAEPTAFMCTVNALIR
jgi:hypothetical protein